MESTDIVGQISVSATKDTFPRAIPSNDFNTPSRPNAPKLDESEPLSSSTPLSARRVVERCTTEQSTYISETLSLDLPEYLIVVEVMNPAILFARIHWLESVQDTRQTTTDIPELGTDAQKHEFCYVYDELKYFQAMCNVSGEAEPLWRCNQVISWLNRMSAKPTTLLVSRTQINNKETKKVVWPPHQKVWREYLVLITIFQFALRQPFQLKLWEARKKGGFNLSGRVPTGNHQLRGGLRNFPSESLMEVNYCT